MLAVVCLVVAVLFGLAPASLAARADAHDITKSSGGRATTSQAFGRLRDGLVVAEVALAFVLALGVGGVMRELGRLERTDTGMNTDGVMTLHLSPRIPDNDYFAIEDRLHQLPGVSAAGFVQLVPLQVAPAPGAARTVPLAPALAFTAYVLSLNIALQLAFARMLLSGKVAAVPPQLHPVNV